MAERKATAPPKKSSAKKGKHIEPPPVDMVLRYPIEVWVSGGEEFVKPDRKYSKQLLVIGYFV